SNQMKLRVSGSLVSSGMVAGALGALSFWPPPQATTVVATSMAAVASPTFPPGTDSRPLRLGYRIFLPAFWAGTSGALLRASSSGCWVVHACRRLSQGLTRGPASRVRRDVMGL